LSRIKFPWERKFLFPGGLGLYGHRIVKNITLVTAGMDEIIVIDKRFISERVNQLRSWNINFVQGDIPNKELIDRYCKDADIVHHLAGVTKVPRIKSESNDQEDKEIKEVAELGTQNILDVISDNCKIILPSTHVVYEGITNVKKDILEDEETSPVLSYAKSKDYNEKQLKKSGKNYVIFRLGSVYGYSTDTMRIDIMPNLFSKITSQNGVLKLFSGGKQIKSLVPLIDVARCFKFIEERKDINKELFNLTKDTVTVKEVAEICKKYNPNVVIRETNDEIPNLGFSLSNKKIKKKWI
jgi:Nucleoside-diphosphate-sugar epimerases